MEKNRKANDAIWMAILEMIRGGQAGNVAANSAILQANIKRDGTQKEDIDESTANQILPVEEKIKLQFAQHPEMLDELNDYVEENNISEPQDINEFGNIIESFLHNIRGYAKGGQFETNDEFVDVTINNKTYHLLNLITEEQKEHGLQSVESMNPDEGALFDYSNEPQAEISFWMKDTTIPLDIIFVNEQGKVISVKQGEPMSEELITESSEFVAYVIELNANSGIKPGYQTSLGETIEETDPDEDDSLEDEYPELKVNHLIIYGSDGQPQGYLKGGERIFSRKSTRVIIRKAKRAYTSQSDTDFKALGKYIFKEMAAQDSREPEYVTN